LSTESLMLSEIRQSPEGIGLSDLLARHPQVARRTAQRWIAGWIEAGKISADGKARVRRYVGAAPSAQTGTADSISRIIPFSDEGREITAYLDRPLAARKPVGYQRDFLDAYRPNTTWYLPAALRRRLHRIGKTAHAPAPAGTYSRAMLNRLLIDLSWASSQLEGNTYSRLDTRKLIEHGRAAKGKDALETQMILNHKTAIELLLENVDTAAFNRYTLFNLHSALSENLLPNAADEGRIRQHAVDISQSVYRPLSSAPLIELALDAMLKKAERIDDPFEQSFFIMVHLPYLQPFADINKRTSRLAANLPLFRANLCPLTFLDVPEPAYSKGVLGVYELTRVELLRDVYVWAYERSAQEYLAIRQELAEPDPVRLAYRDVIREMVHSVVTQTRRNPMTTVDRELSRRVAAADRETVRVLIVEQLERLHEGVLARYGLRPSEFAAWKARRPATG
jgi:hypothetical protein